MPANEESRRGATAALRLQVVAKLRMKRAHSLKVLMKLKLRAEWIRGWSEAS